jgi:hypothetical protein
MDKLFISAANLRIHPIRITDKHKQINIFKWIICLPKTGLYVALLLCTNYVDKRRNLRRGQNEAGKKTEETQDRTSA